MKYILLGVAILFAIILFFMLRVIKGENSAMQL